MIWACICWECVVTMAPARVIINAIKYQDILEKNLCMARASLPDIFLEMGNFFRTMQESTERDQHKSMWTEIA